jgi:stage 0 sporulation regulatory protein
LYDNITEESEDLLYGECLMSIKTEIEQKRKELLNIAKTSGLSSEATLLCSEELDQLITAYQLEKAKNNG